MILMSMISMIAIACGSPSGADQNTTNDNPPVEDASPPPAPTNMNSNDSGRIVPPPDKSDSGVWAYGDGGNHMDSSQDADAEVNVFVDGGENNTDSSTETDGGDDSSDAAGDNEDGSCHQRCHRGYW